jgi:tetratricopeptide (TPR) repeat protein
MKKFCIIVFMLLSFAVQAQIPDRSDIVIDAYGLYYGKSYRESVSAFDRLIESEKYPRAEWFLYRGIGKLKLEEKAEAEIDFRQAEAKGNTEAIIWIARMQALSGMSDDAIQSIAKYLRQSRNPDVQSIKIDSLFSQLQNEDAWFLLWQDYWQTDMQKLFADIDYFLKKKDFKAALSAVNVIKVGNESDKAMLCALRSSVYEGEGNTELALNEINMALSMDALNTDFMRTKVRYLVQLSKYSDAENILSQILSDVPQDFDARYLLANTAMRVENYTLAKKNIEIYLRYFQSDSAKFLAGQICYFTGDYLQSLHYFNPLLEKDKSKASYFKFRGMAYFKTQTYNQAAFDLSMSLDLVPDDAETNFYLGLTEQTIGHRKLSCYYLTRAKNLGDYRALSYLQENCKE